LLAGLGYELLKLSNNHYAELDKYVIPFPSLSSSSKLEIKIRMSTNARKPEIKTTITWLGIIFFN
tara:strand:+ start:2580 stop:2774 length:195 start_codon:yes stop_codon:yes gene_type:complete